MRILICSFGSRGDVQPYLALAVGLRQAGHTVTLAVPRRFEAWVAAYGLRVYPVRYDPVELLQRPGYHGSLQNRSPIRLLRKFREAMRAGAVAALDDFWQASVDADVIVQTGTAGGGVEIASQRRRPLVLAYAQPFTATRAFPSFFWPLTLSLGSTWNFLTHVLAHASLFHLVGGPLLNGWRADRFGLPPWHSYGEMAAAARRMGTPWLHSYSPHVLPKPPDWPEDHHVTGYWFLEEPAGWQPPPDLERFLDEGPPPVFVGFGNMQASDPARLTHLVLEALAATGQRGVLAGGWGGLQPQDAGRNVCFVDEVPHTWLFPRLATTVHHGGAGTTGAGLRAGVPNIVTPFAFDQYAWAARLLKLGLGPHVGPARHLTAKRLATAIVTAVSNEAMLTRAAALGQKLRAENGVQRAVELIGQL